MSPNFGHQALKVGGGLLRLLNFKKRLRLGGTAQGGGGSFKDRKLIGEVSCCDHGRAN